ncbi:hypothetical protein [Pseudonocardia acidicola]|uniref:Uncharacterized protein n=1 Tax=Pseudonocardia acidicola TaxID=2724939 RepID=A0ABX1S810_9PSEU|nr:hypothetical protein [Pseudonocardia acidicola]NMH96511.1 hypothetical protein [Pseudonocardia acidicola]
MTEAGLDAPLSPTPSEALEPTDELGRRCAALADPAAQGEPLTRLEYLLLVFATVVVPTVLIIAGSWL